MRSPQAQGACDRAEQAIAAGDLAAAQALFEYAQRLAPTDDNITLSIAITQLRRRETGAVATFEQLARRFDIREVWLGLAAALHLAGQRRAAITALGTALSRNAPTTDTSALSLQDTIVGDTGAPGWCALSADGTLTVALNPRAGRQAELRITLDGRKLACPPLRPAQGTDRRQLALPEGWRTGRALSATLGDTPLIGSPISLPAIIRVEGFIAAREGGLEGWAWLPGDPDRLAELAVLPAAGGPLLLRITAADERTPVAHPTLLARPRRFAVAAAALARVTGALDVQGWDGRRLYGSPLDPGAEIRSAAAAAGLIRARFPARPGGPPADPAPLSMPVLPADILGAPPTARPMRRGVDVVIPAYRGVAETLACIESVLASGESWMRLLVVDDASPDAPLVAALDALAQQRRITLLRQPRNGGFPAAANAGMAAAAADRDVVLLNSDTLVPKGWLTRLRDAALSAADIGTVTPLSNDATIMSYPQTDRANPVPDAAQTARLDALASQANGQSVVEIPTAIGFCMYIRRECLDAVGLLRADLFAQGYGEENDFCLRARHLGWRHVGLTGLFVGHVGGLSFAAAKAHLLARNLAVLNRQHPGYDAMITAFQRRDPLLPARRRMDTALWQEAGPPEARPPDARLREPRPREARGNRGSQAPRGSVLLLTHDRIGGVLRRVTERCAELRRAGLRPVVLSPRRMADGRPGCLVGEQVDSEFPNLQFAIPDELEALLALLAADRPLAMELHHFIGHDPVMLGLAARLGIPCDVAIHDYAWFCPRITLVGAGERYCGEPDLAGCETCIADLGGKLDETIGPAALIARSTATLAAARRVITPAADVARRLRRHFPALRPEVAPWQDDALLPPHPTPASHAAEGTKLRVCVVGAVGTEKGYDLLLACARDAAARNLDISFTVVGYTSDDARLLATGRCHITGPYAEAEAVALIRAQRAHLGLLPSVWPETWSYVLTQMWQAGLQVAAFDLGTPAERIRRTGRGWLLPQAIRPAAINNALLAMGARSAHGGQPGPVKT